MATSVLVESKVSSSMIGSFMSFTDSAKDHVVK